MKRFSFFLALLLAVSGTGCVDKTNEHLESMDGNMEKLTKEVESYREYVERLTQQIEIMAKSISTMESLASALIMAAIEQLKTDTPPAPTPDIEDVISDEVFEFSDQRGNE